MRTLGLGNRPPRKKKNCKSWEVYQRGGGGGERGLNHALLMMKTINLCLPDFFFIFYQDIAIIKVYCFKLKT